MYYLRIENYNTSYSPPLYKKAPTMMISKINSTKINAAPEILLQHLFIILPPFHYSLYFMV